MEPDEKLFYRDLLRTARAVALADAEGFQAVIHSLELIGQKLHGPGNGFGAYEEELSNLAKVSPLSADVASEHPECHTKFCDLFEELRRARNDAVHQGAHARILTDHAVELSMVMEDALMSDAKLVSQFMVREVVAAKPWHPISYVRQQMLKHAFSYIPVCLEEGAWRLIPEWSVAKYLRGAPSQNVRKQRMVRGVEEAVAEKGLDLLQAETEVPDAPIATVLDYLGERPILVVDPKREDVLIGVLTSADVL